MPPMSQFYICTENRSIIGRMDPQLTFHRDDPDKKHSHGEVHEVREKHPLDRREEKPAINPDFPTLHDLSDQNRQNFANNPPSSSPYHTAATDGATRICRIVDGVTATTTILP